MKYSMIQTEKQQKYNLDKYEYLTGENLDLKPSTVEQAKFEYSPLGKIFNEGLSEDDKKEGLLKRLKNIDKNQNSNNNSHKSELIDTRSESSSYTPLISDDESQTFFCIFKRQVKRIY